MGCEREALEGEEEGDGCRGAAGGEGDDEGDGEEDGEDERHCIDKDV